MNADAPQKLDGRAFTSLLPLGVKKIEKGRNAVRYERRFAVGIHYKLAGLGGLNDDGFDLGVSSIVCLQTHGAGDSVGKW
jgi:hypothetical protein